MKRLSFYLSLAAVFFLAAGVRAQQVSLPLGVTASAGETVEVPITAFTVPDSMYSANLSFLFDNPSVSVDAVTVDSGDVQYRVGTNAGGPDTLHIAWASGDAVELAGDTLVHVSFTVSVAAVRDTFALTWLPYPETQIDEASVPTLDDGEFWISNNLPVWDARPDTFANETETLTFTVGATDQDADDLQYSMIDWPAGATFADPVFEWTPTYDDAGLDTVVFEVWDGYDVVRDTVEIDVFNVNRPPVWDVEPDKSVAENDLLVFTVSATDPDLDGLTYGQVHVPPDANFNTDTQEFSWTPTYDDAGQDSLIVTVEDAEATVYDTIFITVTNTNRPPVWDARPDTFVAEDETLVFTVSATDPDLESLTYGQVHVPPGANFNTDTQVFTWTPTYSDEGTDSLIVTVQDAEATVYDTVWITVNNTNRPPVWDARPDTFVNEGETLTFFVSATDPDLTGVNYADISLPPGATFDTGTGEFSWTPTYDDAGVDSAIFSVDDTEFTVLDTVEITVFNVNRPPVFDPFPADTFIKATETLTLTITATDPDGTIPDVADSSRPAGANFSAGLFDWTPTIDQVGDTVAIFTAWDGEALVVDSVRIQVMELYGDVTQDGFVSATDASWILQHAVNLRTVSKLLGDVTANGFVSAFDAALVLYQVLNPDYVFPVEGGALPKLGASGVRTLAFVGSGSSWSLIADDPSGIAAGQFVLEVPAGATVDVSGGAMVASSQTGSELRVAFVTDPAAGRALINLDGLSSPPKIIEGEFNEGAVAWQHRPLEFGLSQNVPNPFNPVTTIHYSLAEAGMVHLAVYNVNGQLVRTLATGERPAGYHTAVWNGRDDSGRALASGVYLYRLVTPGATITKRMIMVK